MGAYSKRIAIVGAGISGLTTAYAIRSLEPGSDVVVFEAARRVGGKVWTEASPEGFLCEGGVNGFLDKVPRTLALCDSIGLVPVSASASAQSRYVFSERQLHRLPEGPLQFLTSDLLSVRGRLRVLYETVAPGTDADDESLADFGTRRLGREAFEKLIDPMASGVFAGDATAMSLKSCFPRIHEIEMQYGSLIRGLIRLQARARREGRRDSPGPGPGGRLTSFADGMSTLTDRLAAGLGDRVRTGTAVGAIARSGERYELQLPGGGVEAAEVVILAVPAFVQARLLESLDHRFAALLDGIEYPPVTVVCFGYRNPPAGQVPDGFGFLVPSRERRSVLGTVVDSNVFPGRAPGSSALLRTLVGGARNPQFAAIADEPLIGRVMGDLKDIAGVSMTPDFVRIFRHERAIPQYRVGHAARLRALDEVRSRHPGLLLTGNAFRGVSLNDCVVNAWQAAEAVVQAHDPARDRLS